MRRSVAILAACAALVIASAACANPDDPAVPGAAQGAAYPAPPDVRRDDVLAAMVPPEVSARGTMVVAMNSGIPPIKFRDTDGAVTGFNPQLIEAAATLMGLGVDYQEVPFDALVPGLESRRFDLIASVGDFAERRERTDFIDYLTYGTAIMVRAGFDRDALTPTDLCGLRVAYTRGAAQQGLVERADTGCAAAAREPIAHVALKDANAAVLAVQSDQADAVWGDSPALIYNATTRPDTYKVVFEELEGPYGIGVLRDNGRLRDALRAALRQLAASGVYQRLLTDWNLDPEAALPDFPVNTGPAQS